MALKFEGEIVVKIATESGRRIRILIENLNQFVVRLSRSDFALNSRATFCGIHLASLSRIALCCGALARFVNSSGSFL